MSGSLTADPIKARARQIGFDLCGIAPADGFPELQFLSEWVNRGYAGEMGYMVRTARQRADVRQVLPSARSVIVTGVVYNVDRPYSTELADPADARIARYAWGDDYHEVIGRRLQSLLTWMRGENDEPFEARAYVDTGPIQERVYAQYAGLGWIGKNTCLINADRGSWIFLAEIVCSLALTPDEPGFDRCGSCRLCIEACPTGAIAEPWRLDATKCLSYLTIELKAAIPEEQRPQLGSHVYGCDVCQEVCPWNAAPARSREPAWMPRAGLDRPRLDELWRASDADLTSMLKGSAMKRAKLRGVRRNLAVAMGNAGLMRDEPAESEGRPSLDDPIVREHVTWAKSRAVGDGPAQQEPRDRSMPRGGSG